MTLAMKQFAVALLVPLMLQAQSVPSLGETMEVSIVNVDVFVTDKQGNRVRGLTKDDFQVLENGTPQPISNFAEYRGVAETTGVATEAVASTEVAPRQQRTLIVFFEEMRLPQNTIKPLVEQMKQLVRSTVRDGDTVGLVLWSPQAAAQTQLLNDVASFERAIDAFARRATGVEFNQIGALRQEVADIMQFQAEVAAMAGGGGGQGPAREALPSTSGSTTGTAASPELQTEMAAQTAMTRSLLEMKRRVAAINATINSISAIEGKKVLLLATHRLGEVAGAEFVVTGGRPPSFMSKQKFGTEKLIKSIIDNANAAAVTIYPIYPPGIKGTTVDASTTLTPDLAYDSLVLQNEMVSLDQIAKSTGGVSAFGPDAVKVLPAIQQDVSDYYSLAYRVTGGRADRARSIVVKTKNPAYTVRSRREFVEKTDETRMKDRVVGALFRKSEAASIPIATEVGAGKKTRRQETFPLKVKIPIGALTLLPQGNGKHSGAFSVYLVTGARLEEVSSVTIRTQPFEIPDADVPRARAGHFTYSLDVVVNSRAERIAVGVLDEVGKTFGLAQLSLEEETVAKK